ncbi:MAG: gfo/Idh/MocA family oxidoreductase [Frankiales bacterium]|nr:gfo/Idh/MocA family oxidoreductase [Frankiales bacterium]
MSNEALKWGLIGTQGYAEKTCLPAFAGVPAAELAAVASSSAQRAAEFATAHGIDRSYGAVAELCADAEVSAVWIASGSYLHFEHASQAIAAGKHVLLEKPLALTAGEAWQLVKLADAAGLVLACGYQARYVPAHQRMQQLIAEGAIGEVVAVRSLYGMRRVGPPRTWRGERDKARWGVLADIGTHHIDLMRMLVGEIAEATGYSAHQRGYETEDLAVASLRFQRGALATMTVTGSYYRPRTIMEVVGTEGAVIATDTSPSGQGTAELIRPDGSSVDITGETPLSGIAQLRTVNQAMSGEQVAYASGEDGARNLDILEMIAP